MTVAFILAGGGSLAATHVGMLRALTDKGIVPDLIVGTSAGAINAFCYANSPTEEGLDRLEELWSGLRRRDVFPVRPKDVLAGLIGRRDGFVSSDPLRAFLTAQIGDERLQDAKVPVHIVATDLAEGEPTVLSAGPAIPALLASAALPGVFPPVVIDGHSYVDGAVTADTPIRQAHDLGATELYVLPTVSPKAPTQVPKGALPVLFRAIDQMFGHVVATDVASIRGEVHVLPAPRHGTTSPFDFRSTERLISESYAAARIALGMDPEPEPTARVFHFPRAAQSQQHRSPARISVAATSEATAPVAALHAVPEPLAEPAPRRASRFLRFEVEPAELLSRAVKLPWFDAEAALRLLRLRRTGPRTTPGVLPVPGPELS